MVRRTDGPLVMTDTVVREIAQEINAKFKLISDRQSIHIEPSYVMIYVHVNKDKLILPYGPVVLTIEEGHPILDRLDG